MTPRTLVVACWAMLFFTNLACGQIQPASDAPQPMSPTESAAQVQLPDGIKMELVASEPLIQDPSCIAFDEFGRLFVTELHGYNVEGHLDVERLNATGQLDRKVRRLRWELMGGEIAEQALRLQFGVLKLLTDNDGDGRMDHAEVWADDLPPCYGVVAARGGVIVVCAPDIVYFADRDLDGKVDFRETLFTGFDHTVMERGINNPIWGLDNWIYVGAGRHSGTIRGPHLAEPVALGNQDFRIKPDGTAIEPVSGNVATFGLGMNDIGDRFPCSGGQPAVCAIPLPHRFLARNPFVAMPAHNYGAADYAQGFRISEPHPWRVKRAQDPAWVKFYGKRENDSSYFSGGCGGLVYEADGLPDEYRGSFFYCEPSLNIVHRCLLERDGAGYRARRARGEEASEFVASTDQWFRPMNLRVGPDGALYVVDMYREIIEDYSAIPRFLQQQYGLMRGSEHGRIWRLVSAEWADAQTHRVEAGWPAELTTVQLAEATSDPNPWWRTTAQRLIVDRGDVAARDALADQVRSGNTNSSRIHALYTLEGLASLQAADIRHALDDGDYGVRTHAVRLAATRLSNDPTLLSKVAALVSDRDARVRLEVAMALGEATHPSATQALVDLSIQFGGDRWMAAAVLSSASRSAGELFVRLLGAPAFKADANRLLPQLAATVGGQGDPDEINRLLHEMQARGGPREQNLAGLSDGIAQSGQSIGAPKDGWQALKSMLREPSPGIRVIASRIASQLQLHDSQELRTVFDAASREAIDGERPTSRRVDAMRVLSNARFELLAPAAAHLLDPRQPPALQEAAVQALDRSNDVRVGGVLLNSWSSFTPETRTAVLNAIFARENRLPALIDALEKGQVSRVELNAVQREQLIKNRNSDLADAAQELLADADADDELELRYELYQKMLASKRDAGQGELVFTKLCLNCHKVRDAGFEVGPPLGSVVRKPDEAILRDLLDPNTHIDPEFTSYVVVTRDGRTFTGILSSESATSVSLLKEKGIRETILRKDIDILVASSASLMPANLYEQMKPVDAANVIAYIRKEFE